LGGGHQTIDHFRVQAHIQLEHEVDDAADFPGGLEEEFEIPAGLGGTGEQEAIDDVDLIVTADVTNGELQLKVVFGFQFSVVKSQRWSAIRGQLTKKDNNLCIYNGL
jgi:hypothetical protein